MNVREYYLSCDKFINIDPKIEESYLRISKILPSGAFTTRFRKKEGNRTYIYREHENHYVIGKYIGYIDSIKLNGLPIPKEINIESLKGSVELLDEIMGYGKVSCLLNENELKVLKKYGDLHKYHISFYDSIFYDDIRLFLSKTKNEKYRGLHKDPNVEFRKLDLGDYEYVRILLKELQDKYEKDDYYFRGDFYKNFLEDYSDYDVFGLFYNGMIVFAYALWYSGNVARTDVIVKLYRDDAYKKYNIPNKVKNCCEVVTKYFLYNWFLENKPEIDYLDVDGAGPISEKKGMTLRTHKTERYNNKMDIYLVRRE